MGFNLGAGLSQMGSAVANTSEAMGLQMQKSDLEQQRDQLAAATAHGYKSQEMEEAGGIAATAAEKLADVNAKAAKIQQDFETGLEKIRSQTSENVANIGAAAQIKSAGISASASMANVKAQLQEGDIQTSPDGTLIKIDRTTGKSSPVVDDDGNPVKGIVPGQAALMRDAVNANNEQLRALTIRYDNDLKGPQQALEQALKSGDDSDPEVIQARRDVQNVKDEYKAAFAHLNSNMDAIVGSLSTKAQLPGSGPGGQPGNKPPLSSFDRSAPKTPQTPGLINTQQ